MLIPLDARPADPLRRRRREGRRHGHRRPAARSSRWPTWARTPSSCTTRTAPDPSLAFALARLSRSVHEPTPIGVFRAVERPEYADRGRAASCCAAAEQKGPGDLGALLRSNGTWTVE